jgi:hypothetical protein
VTETLNSTFMQRHFGDEAQRVAAALVDAGNEAHLRSLDAKTGSRLRTNHAYGSTFWLALPQEVVARLLPILDGSVTFPPRGAPYELLAWNGIAILPVKVMEAGMRDSRMRARHSQLRSSLTQVNLPKTPEPTLFDDPDGIALDEFEDGTREATDAAREAIARIAGKTLVAAYSCSPKSGLQSLRVGIATLDTDGQINFSDSERLSLIQTPVAASMLTTATGATFDAAPRPKPLLEFVEEAATATGEHAPGDQTPRSADE